MTMRYRKQKRTIWALVISISILGTLIAAMAGERNESVRVGGIDLDRTYAGFIFSGLKDNENAYPGLGYTAGYSSDEGEATIYVYDKGQQDISDGPMSQIVMAEFNEATREVLAIGRFTGEKIELVSRYGTGSPKRGVEFLCAEFVLSDNLGARRSFLYLTGIAEKFLKIRVTLRTNNEADPAARNFADAVAGGLPWKGSHIK